MYACIHICMYVCMYVCMYKQKGVIVNLFFYFMTHRFLKVGASRPLPVHFQQKHRCMYASMYRCTTFTNACIIDIRTFVD